MARVSVEERRAIHATCETILDRLDAMERQPDSWEETCLVHALSYMEAGLYERAAKELTDCVIPLVERPSWRANQAEKNPRRYTAERLRARLDHLKAEAR